MQVLSIKDYAASKNFTQAATHVRTNVNKYPFVTFINKDNVAENIYFSKQSAKNVTEGQAVTKELLTTHQIAIVKNANNEERVKLIGNTERVTLTDMW